jgi:hypothetical protein
MSTTDFYQKIDCYNSDTATDNSDIVDNQYNIAGNQGSSLGVTQGAPSNSPSDRITNTDQCSLPNHQGHYASKILQHMLI